MGPYPHKAFGTGVSCRGSSAQGYDTISDDQNNNRLRLAAGLEGHGKTSIEDFNEILGSTHYAKPKVV